MTDAPDTTPLPNAPKPVRVALIALACALGATVLAGLWVALIAAPEFRLWIAITLGFEAITLAAACVALGLGLGRFRAGFGLAALCVAGTAAVTGFFGLELAASPNIRPAILAGDSPEITLRVIRYTVLARLALAGLGVALATLAVLSRNAASWRPLRNGLILLLPVLALSVWLFRYDGVSVIVGPVDSGLGVARLIAALFGALVLLVIASIGGHLIIRAFEMTAPDSPEAGRPAAGVKPSGSEPNDGATA